jgi:hypothetical protein
MFQEAIRTLTRGGGGAAGSAASRAEATISGKRMFIALSELSMKTGNFHG